MPARIISYQLDTKNTNLFAGQWKFVTTLSNLIEFYCETLFRKRFFYCRESRPKIQLKSPDMLSIFGAVFAVDSAQLLLRAETACLQRNCNIMNAACLNIFLTLFAYTLQEIVVEGGKESSLRCYYLQP